jgi:membrane protease YdiL (CAAX protease family)
MNSAVKPGNPWNAKHAWTFLLAVGVGVLLDQAVFWILLQTRRGFADWAFKHSPIIDIAMTIFTYCWWLLFVFLCSKVKTVYNFVHGIGLNRRLTLSSWFYGWVAIGIGLLMHYGTIKGWGIQPSLTLGFGFYKLGGVYWLFFIISACVVAPIVEEMVMRGFLYRAFRGSYDIFLSIFLILCVHGFSTSICFIHCLTLAV